MRKLFFVISSLAALHAFGQGSVNYGIDGTTEGIKDTIKQVYLVYRFNDATIRDSAVVKNGKFSFSGSVTEPVKVTIYVRYTSSNPELQQIEQGRDVLSVFVEPQQKITLDCKSDSFAHATVKGGALNTELQKIQAGEAKYDAQTAPLFKQYSEARKNKNKALGDSIEKQIDLVDSIETEDVYGKYIKAHPTSPIALFVLEDYAGYMIDADKIGPMFDKLPAAQKNYTAAKTFKEKIDIAAKTGVGKPALDFVQNDTLGNPIKLSSFKGKYVLLDFWASWCGPCRRENPNVVAAYNKFKEKGFTVLSVSLDQPGAKEKWMKAIHDDNLTWTHVSDLKFWDNEVAKEYGIQAIPQNFLIDPTGKIVAKDLTGDGLDQKLASLLN